MFDKALREYFHIGNWQGLIEDLVLEELSSINMDVLICPVCGSCDVDWNYCYSRSHRLIWDNPDTPIHIQTPTYQYYCHHCNSSGVEAISPDLCIGKTDLSYHYLLGILRNRLYPANMSIYDLYNVLYGKLSEESSKRWAKRYRADFSVLSLLCKVNEFDFLSESVSYF